MQTTLSKKKEMARVSVIIPTFNDAIHLERSIQSVLAQSCKDWELVIVDNHSTDNTDEVLAHYQDPRIKILKIHNDGVIAKSRNLGATHSRAKFIAFLDSDDWWHRDKLLVSLTALESGAAIVFHDCFRVGSLSDRLLRRRVKSWQPNDDVFADMARRGNPIVNSTVVMRRDAFEAVGGISEDPEIVGAEDFDLWIRIAQKRVKFRKLEKTLGYYWWGSGNTSSPHRTVKFIKRLCELHFLDANAKIPSWAWYDLYRASYLLGDSETARKIFRDRDFEDVALSKIVKIGYMKAMIFLDALSKYTGRP